MDHYAHWVKAYYVQKIVIFHVIIADRCRLEMISMFNLHVLVALLLCVDVVTLSLSLFILSLAHFVFICFCSFRWTTPCVFTEGVDVVIGNRFLPLVYRIATYRIAM